MKQFCCRKVKITMAFLFAVTILTVIFSLTSFAVESELKYTIGVGESIRISELAKAENYTYDEQLLTLSQNGDLVAVAVGETNITYVDADKVLHTVSVTVKKAPSYVKLNATNLTLCVGESYTFKPTIGNDEYCSSFSFASDKSDILAQSKDGKFTAKKAGTAKVTVSTYNGKKATCTVTVKKAPSTVKLNATKLTLGIGETFTFKPTIGKDEYCQKFTFTSDKSDVFAHSKDGKFTAKKAGIAKVTVTTHNGKKATCTITVKKAPTTVKLNTTKLTLGVGETFTFKPTVGKDEHSSSFNFTSDKANILAHSKDGKFTAKKAGTAKVTVKTYNGKKVTCTVTVKKAPTKITLNSGSKITIGVGEAYDFNSSFGKDEACHATAYSTNKPDILVYSKSGIFTAKKTGTAKVTAKTYNGKTATCTVTVKKAPSTVKLNASSVTLGVGESFDFNSSVGKNEGCSNFSYSTNKTSILTYSKKGIFTAKKAGTAKVTVKTYNGKKATATVKVYPLPSSISVKNTSYNITIGKSKTAEVVLPKGTACNTFTYKSSAPSVVSVSSSGKFKGLKVGSAKITVKSKNGKTASFTVNVKAMNVPFVNQNPTYPTGCEAASAVQLLRYYGYNVSLDTMVNAIPRENIVVKNGRRYGPDINKKFVGNPRGTYTSGNPGYGAFSPVVTKSLQKVIDANGGKHTAVKITGCSFTELLKQISNGHPAIVWATYKMNNPASVNSWYIPQANGTAKYFEYPRGTHVMVLRGYSDSYVWITDPILGNVTYSISTFEARWNLLGKQAIILEKKK
ncbi:MAG: C39 family peptidase [Faecalibacterium sp.]|nr:C39 family peptidase [Ruminococcus sp.]MCM1392195.1 C39 family peptidase [Ruminococcus sp.]MCM1485395.1 C39 family peptidase [Faecalibacterium sp.]